VSLLGQRATLAAAFAGGTALAVLLGAVNLGTAAAFGQIAFLIALTYLLLRR
jgi:hypothetical protein